MFIPAAVNREIRRDFLVELVIFDHLTHALLDHFLDGFLLGRADEVVVPARIEEGFGGFDVCD